MNNLSYLYKFLGLIQEIGPTYRGLSAVSRNPKDNKFPGCRGLACYSVGQAAARSIRSATIKVICGDSSG